MLNRLLVINLALAFGIAYAAEAYLVTDGLVSHWSFDVIEDGMVEDPAGNHNGTLIEDVTGDTGKSYGALAFGGNNAHVEIADPEAFVCNADFTWCAWIRTDRGGVIVAKTPGEGDPEGPKTFFIRHGVLNFDVGWVTNVMGERVVTDNQWHYVAVTVEFDGADTIQFYVDGEPDAQGQMNVDTFPEDGFPLMIGFDSRAGQGEVPGLGEFANFIGTIDEVSVYNRVLSADEIQQNFAAEPPLYRVEIDVDSVDVQVGASAVVQLSISDATGMASGDIVIEYDTSLITIDEVIAMELLSGMIMIPNTAVLGEIRLSMAGASGIPSGSGALVEIGLTVSADAEVGTETTLSFGDTAIYDELGVEITISLKDGVVRTTWPGVKGDVSNDGEVLSNDAILALQFAAHVLIPTEYQHWAADMNDDGYVRANDVTLILRKAIGLAAPGRDIIASGGGHITMMLSEAHGIRGERVSVPIKVDNADILASGDICIAYDSTVLRAVDVLSDSGALLVSDASEPGILRIAFASVNRLNTQTIAEIQFDVLSDTASLLRFRKVELYGPDALPVNSSWSDGRFLPSSMTPEHNALLQNYPNPFNPETWIPYQLAEPADVTIAIYGTTGQLVRRLDIGSMMPGHYADKSSAAYWDGRNEAGEQVSSGVYFYTIQVGDFTATRKMVVAK